MQASYPTFNPGDKLATLNLWAEMFKDIPYEVVSLALKSYIVSESTAFAPSIGQLMGKLQQVTTKEPLNEMEAWALVRKAINDSYYNAEERFAELPEVVQRVVGNPGNLRMWSQAREDSVETVIQSNFIKTYRTTLKRDEEYMRLPADVRKLLDVNQKGLIDVRS